LLSALLQAGVSIEPDAVSRDTSVASFPIHAGDGIRSVKQLTIWEQLQLAAIMQRDWSDNGVSVTVSVNSHNTSKRELLSAIEMYQYSLKSVSFLPEVDGGAYAQMPYEEIDKDTYERMNSQIDYSKLKSLSQVNMEDSAMRDMYCDGAACEIKH
jgi:hypothetical protein